MKRSKADAILLMITVVWGVTFPLMKNVLDYMPTFAYLTLRYSLAFIIISIIFIKSLLKVDIKTVLYGLVLGIFLYSGMALQVAGLNYTTASNSGFITGLSVVMVPVISAVILKKKPGIDSVGGIILAVIGLGMLTGVFSKGINFNKGDLLTLCCAVCWAFYIIFVDRFSLKKDPKALSAIQFFFASVFYAISWALTGGKAIEFSWPAFNIIIFTSVFCTVIAFGAQMMVQRYTSPTHTALIFTAEPVFALLFALVIPNSAGVTETMKLVTAFGCMLILSGMFLSELKPFQKIFINRLTKAV